MGLLGIDLPAMSERFDNVFVYMKLVFLHGRSQEDKDPLVLRQKWIDALGEGLDKAGLELPIDERDIVFPYYGDALRDVTSEAPQSLAAVRFPMREYEAGFAREVLHEYLDEAGITADVIASETEPDEDFGDRLSAFLSNEWTRRGLSLLDRYVPQASALSIESTAADVGQYLNDPEVQGHIENGVARAFDDCTSEETVVVAHSLGSIVAYRVLAEGGRIGCPVKSLITVGSPLGIKVIRQALQPIGHPPNVGSWFNAFDERDIIALNPLNDDHFDVSPPIKNYAGVENESDNHHKVHGYLSDRVVATKIVQALRTPEPTPRGN